MIMFFLFRPFSLDYFDDYQKHFTVMNYAEGVQLKQVLLVGCWEFRAMSAVVRNTLSISSICRGL